MANIKNLWAEKYRPQSLSDYIFQNETQAAQIKQMIEAGEIPHLLLTGPPGTGKTSLAHVLIKELNLDEGDLLYVNGSKDNSVEFVRDTVEPFAMSYPMGKFKVIWIDEADYLSFNAQALLRVPLEQTSDTCRFILSCNFDNKILPAIKSRVPPLVIKAPTYNDVLMRAGDILISERINFDVEVLEKVVAACYPDVRKVIGTLENSSKTGELQLAEVVESDYHYKLLDLLAAGDLKSARKLVCDNVSREEFETIYRFLYENIGRVPKLPQDEAVLVIADYLYRHALVADPEINFAACMIELAQLLKK